MSKNFGFTLAEVSIVLIVVGIAAAMTIPMVVNNFTKDAQVAELRKVAQDFETAVYTETTNEGKNSFRLTPIFLQGNMSDFIDRNFGTNSDSCVNSGCFASSYKSINGTSQGYNCSGTARKLPGGAAICAEYINGRVANRTSLSGLASLKLALSILPGSGGKITPDFPGGGGNLVNPNLPAVFIGTEPPFIKVQIDTNNTAGPNTGGRDMFTFYISEYGDVLGTLPVANSDSCLSFGHVYNTTTKTLEDVCLIYKKETITDEETATAEECKSSALGEKCYTHLYQNDWVMDY